MINRLIIHIMYGILFYLGALEVDANDQPYSMSINIDGETITNVPDEIFDYRSLKSLKIQTKVPFRLQSAIGCLTNLEELDISYVGEWGQNINTITQTFDNSIIPIEIDKLIRLKTIRLHHVIISSLQHNIVNLPKLRELTLHGCLRGKIPVSVYQMRQLEVLSMCENRIEEIASEIKNLNCMKKLDLRNNELNQLPNEIYELQNLITLNISQNKALSFISSSITNLVNLECLDLRNTSIKAVNELIHSLINMNNLRILRLDGISKADYDIIKKYLPNCEIEVRVYSVDPILTYFQYYSRCRFDGSWDLYKAKRELGNNYTGSVNMVPKKATLTGQEKRDSQ